MVLVQPWCQVRYTPLNCECGSEDVPGFMLRPPRGVEHAVEVNAGSVYEAVAQALRIFRDNEWVEGIGRGLR